MLAPVVLDDFLHKDKSSHLRKDSSASSSTVRHYSVTSALIQPTTNPASASNSTPVSRRHRRGSVASRRGRRQTLPEFDTDPRARVTDLLADKSSTVLASTPASSSVNALRRSASETRRETLPAMSFGPRSRLSSLVADMPSAAPVSTSSPSSTDALRRRATQARKWREKHNSAENNKGMQALLVADTLEYGENSQGKETYGLTQQVTAALQRMAKSGDGELDLSFSSADGLWLPPPAPGSRWPCDASSEQKMEDVVNPRRSAPPPKRRALTGEDKSLRRGTTASQGLFYSSASPMQGAPPKKGGAPPIIGPPRVDLADTVHNSERDEKDKHKKGHSSHTIADILGDLDEHPLKELSRQKEKRAVSLELANENNRAPMPPMSELGSLYTNGGFLPELTGKSNRAPMPPMSEVGSPYTNGEFVLRDGSRVHVLSRDELRGSARVRDAIGREATLPDVAFRCDGEVARGLVSEYPDGFSPDPGGPKGQLRLPHGSLVRIVGEEGVYYKVSVDGMRGFVAKSAVEVAAHNLRDALQMQRLEKKVPAVGASTMRGSIEDIKEDTFAIIRNFRLSTTAPKEGKNAAKFKWWKQNLAPWLQPQRRHVPYVFGAWAYGATFWAAFCLFMHSIAGLYHSQRQSFQMPRALYLQYHSTGHNGLIIYCLIWSVGIALVHAPPVAARWDFWTSSGGPSESRFMWRGAIKASIFALSSIPMFFSYFTLIPAAVNTSIGFLYLISFLRREVGKITPTPRAPTGCYSMTKYESIASVWAQISTQLALHWSQIAMSWSVSIVASWFALNMLLFIYGYFITVHSVQRLDKTTTGCWTGTDVSFTGECSKLLDVYKTFFAVARGFSMCINVNSALIFLVASPSVVREVNRMMGASPGIMSSIWGFAPLSNPAACHKFLGVAVLIFGILHSWAHYMAQTFTLPIFPFNVFLIGEINVHKGIWPTHLLWATGAVLLFVLIFMVAAVQRFIRDISYQLFFYAHVIGSVLYFALMLFHGKDFWWCTLVPLIIYSIDRYHQSYSHSTSLIKLVELNFTDPVLNLVFSVPWKYETAQRVFFSCPLLSPKDWHSVAISSPSESDYVSLHFITRPGGWAERLRELCAELVQECEKEGKGVRIQTENGFSFKFASTDWVTGRKTVGISIWSNRPLFILDGPRSSPAMHFMKFETVMLVCTSAALPMLHSILASLVLHRWREESARNPIQLYVVWLCPQYEVSAHRWFMEALCEFEVALYAMSEPWKTHDGEPQRYFACEMHFFVTSATEQHPPVSLPPPRKIVRHRGKAQVELLQPYVASDLLSVMRSAQTPAETFSDVMSQNEALRMNVMGHASIWNGRPPWGDVFHRVRLRHSSPNALGHRVGVVVGAPLNVSRDVYKTARELSDSTITFQVMRDTFE
eukprot:GEMP01001419.1.p1 GENE.GEMP01001419.1~~GEMP01001419.1.p1  ORF type:complete len:1394 (+),score=304.80 GEMP01001419.1:390-4571(+)